jgi:hypothetical protein
LEAQVDSGFKRLIPDASNMDFNMGVNMGFNMDFKVNLHHPTVTVPSTVVSH